MTPLGLSSPLCPQEWQGFHCDSGSISLHSCISLSSHGDGRGRKGKHPLSGEFGLLLPRKCPWIKRREPLNSSGLVPASEGRPMAQTVPEQDSCLIPPSLVSFLNEGAWKGRAPWALVSCLWSSPIPLCGGISPCRGRGGGTVHTHCHTPSP